MLIRIEAPERTAFIVQIENELNEELMKILPTMTNEENTIKAFEEILVFSQAVGAII